MTREEILNAAKACVCGDREQDYGHPENSFAVIADLWNVYINARRYFKGFVGDILDAKDVAAMMILFKVAREATGRGKADNWIDAAGYAACGGEVEGWNNENQA